MLFELFDYEATTLPSTVTVPLTTMVCVVGFGVGVGAGGVGVGAGGVGVGAGGVGVGAGARAAKSFVTTGAPKPVQQS